MRLDPVTVRASNIAQIYLGLESFKASLTAESDCVPSAGLGFPVVKLQNANISFTAVNAGMRQQVSGDVLAISLAVTLGRFFDWLPMFEEISTDSLVKNETPTLGYCFEDIEVLAVLLGQRREFTAEREIVADERAVADDHAEGEHLVVGISYADTNQELLCSGLSLEQYCLCI